MWLQTWYRELCASGMILLAAVLQIHLFKEIYWLPTRRTLVVSLVVNLLLWGGIRLLLRKGLEWKYREWNPGDSSFYRTWCETRAKQHSYLNRIAGLLLALAVIYYFFCMTRLYVYNYSVAYTAIFTVSIQYCLIQRQLDQFLQQWLDWMMDSVTELNRRQLAAAVQRERQSMEAAARSERLKVDLISNVSHDLKTPLTSMVGYIELLKKEELNPVSADYVEVISDKAQKLKEMIESLFNLAKASSGNVQLHMEEMELNMLVKQLFADMEDQIRESGLTFVQILCPSDTHLVSDNIHLYRICQNLMENAIKYSAKGTRVFVQTRVEGGSGMGDGRCAAGINGTPGPVTGGSTARDKKEGSWLCLEMTNTAGYPMDFTKEDILERFARGDKARTSDGNGLGLAIVSTYASALGGDFDIKMDCDQFKAILRLPRKTGDAAESIPG